MVGLNDGTATTIVAPLTANITIFALIYPGASSAWNVWGPIILAIENAIWIAAFVATFFV
jgi:hypothetical protein